MLPWKGEGKEGKKRKEREEEERKGERGKKEGEKCKGTEWVGILGKKEKVCEKK